MQPGASGRPHGGQKVPPSAGRRSFGAGITLIARRPYGDKRCLSTRAGAHSGQQVPLSRVGAYTVDRKCRPHGGRNVPHSGVGRPYGRQKLPPLRIRRRGVLFIPVWYFLVLRKFRKICRPFGAGAAFSEIFSIFRVPPCAFGAGAALSQDQLGGGRPRPPLPGSAPVMFSVI